MRRLLLELPELLQQFFCVYLVSQRNASACTVASYRDTLRLLLQFLASRLNRPVTHCSWQTSMRSICWIF